MNVELQQSHKSEMKWPTLGVVGVGSDVDFAYIIHIIYLILVHHINSCSHIYRYDARYPLFLHSNPY